MSFLKSMWKSGSKHQKLCEELALANSIKGIADGPHEDVDEVTDDVITFDVKFLGSSSIDQDAEEEEEQEFKDKKKKRLKPRSDIITSNAIKRIINTSKNNKKLNRVSLAISPKGISVWDPVTGDTIQQISIYKISFCSVEKSFQDVFAFVGSNIEKEPETLTTQFIEIPTSAKLERAEEENLVCYAFLCPKKKIAQKMALTVARAFERAYQIWQNQESQKDHNKASTIIENKENKQNFNFDTIGGCDENGRNMLIDFSSDSTTTELCFKENKEYLQNTWVSFDDFNQQDYTVSNSQKCSDKSWDNNKTPLCL